ncbi:MAG: hypothetical protein DMD96_14435 [Candidatus Rokuibacteriota bacterium]|nr:MAG: hypothetical protein DMD96_14435 [Candidatus Rokubacteria bacterium]
MREAPGVANRKKLPSRVRPSDRGPALVDHPVERPGLSVSALFATIRTAGRSWHTDCRLCGQEDRRMRHFTAALTLVTLMVVALAACTSTTGKTAGENIDDMTITSEVKAKLAAEKISTLTRIGVETNHRTVYLTGTVDSEEMRSRAVEIAQNVKHVSSVVNNLTVQATR